MSPSADSGGVRGTAVGAFADTADRYRLDSRIATGGMGEVWRATDTVLGREVAVKVLKAEYADDDVFRRRFAAEARNAAALHHPNVAAVFDFGETERGDGSGAVRPYLVMELVDGEPLSALLRGERAMPADRARALATQAADGLAAAHTHGIVHRDVKPANLIVTDAGTVKITDFGIARAAGASPLTQTGQVIGTPHYLSPEQASGQEASPASDVYGLGVVLYECLAGRRPFAGGTPVATALAHLREPVPPLPDDVPAELRAIVERSLAKEPSERFADAGELGRALRGEDVPGTASPAAGAGLAGAFASSTKLMTGLLAGAAGSGTGATSTTRVLADAPARSRRPLPVWWPMAAAALAVLLVVGVAVALGGDGGGDAAPAADRRATGAASSETPNRSSVTRPARATSSTTADDRVRLREGTFLGRDHHEVKDVLEQRGFGVEEQKVPGTSSGEKDTVAALDPHGLVQPGAQITMSVYEDYHEPPPPKEPKGKAEGDEHGKGKAKGHED